MPRKEPTGTTPAMPSIRTVLRLLGFISPGVEGDITAAKKLCCRTLGFPEDLSRDDGALAVRVRPVLEARGLGDLSKAPAAKASRSKPGKVRCHVAGAVWRKGKVKGIKVEIEQVSLLGEVKKPTLAKTTTTEHGQFAVTVMLARPALVRVRFVSSDGTQYLSLSQTATPDMWFEWFEAHDDSLKCGLASDATRARGKATIDRVPQPGRFEQRDALLSSTLAPMLALTFLDAILLMVHPASEMI